MAKEIERKFLVRDRGWEALATSARRLRQGYLAVTPTVSVRVRVVEGGEARLTVKSAAAGPVRDEFEYAIPAADGEALLGLCGLPPVEKVRHLVPSGGRVWEVDEFAGLNAGLVVAEIELEREDAAFERPGWLGEDVTLDSRYANQSLAETPFSRWPRG